MQRQGRNVNSSTCGGKKFHPRHVVFHHKCVDSDINLFNKLKKFKKKGEESRRCRLSEILQRVDAVRQPSERVEEGDDFVASEFEVSLPHGRQIEGGGIGLIKRARKEDLERRAEALRLQFAPEFAFLAADAVHDLRHVAEVVAEFHFQLLGVTTAAEHGRLVKVRAE